MRFWELNKWKILQRWVLLTVIYLLSFFFSKNQNFFSVITVAAVGLSTLIVGIVALGGLLSYKALRRLTEDVSEKSILPLFDSGYTITLKNIHNWFLFTQEQLSSTISGFPVNIFFCRGEVLQVLFFLFTG